MLEDVLHQIDSTKSEALARLLGFLRIPSISTSSEHAADVKHCAQWLATELRAVQLDARIHETPGQPVVMAHNEHVPGRPTVLFYGHYDVQPAEPLEQWHSAPFEPTVRDGAIYARGAADDKGQIWAHVEAIRAWQASGGVPVNLTMLIEGEEEIGSPNLQHFIEKHHKRLQADVAVVSDTSQFARGIPAITYGLRGLVYEEITLEGASHDLHSGIFGGAVPNPANILAEILGTLHDSSGRVNIPGFYDDVMNLETQEREIWAKLPFSEESFRQELQLTQLCGEEGFSTIERKWARPTCDINGITTGFQGEGAKTVIPAKASAKVSMRLVPNQDPQKIHQAFERAIRERCPGTVKLTVRSHSMAEPFVMPLGSRAMALAADALRIGFGAEPTFMREGGTLPVVGLIKKMVGVDTLLVGFGLPDDRPHSPNEKFDLDAFHKGTRTAAALYSRLEDLR